MKAQWHSGTSVAAAIEVEPKTEAIRTMVLELLRCPGSRQGLTDEEIMEKMGLPPNTSRPRRVELFEMDLVRNTLKTRTLHSGLQGFIWKAVLHEVYSGEELLLCTFQAANALDLMSDLRHSGIDGQHIQDPPDLPEHKFKRRTKVTKNNLKIVRDILETLKGDKPELEAVLNWVIEEVATYAEGKK